MSPGVVNGKAKSMLAGSRHDIFRYGRLPRPWSVMVPFVEDGECT